jgi:antibiotic biosynthesis monooxygenase (ABM) superfamily enzyme
VSEQITLSDRTSAQAGPVSLVTQTRVRDGMADEFGRWQSTISAVAAEFPGFVEQIVMPPSPPVQVDWVIVQRFASAEAASAWLRSDRRTRLLDSVQPMLVGPDDVHVVRDDAAGVRPAPVSAVISTRVRPGQEAAYRAWAQRIAVAQAKFAGFRGYRFESPIPGVQDDWLAILRFDTGAIFRRGWTRPSGRSFWRSRRCSWRSATLAWCVPGSSNGSRWPTGPRRLRSGSRT